MSDLLYLAVEADWRSCCRADYYPLPEFGDRQRIVMAGEKGMVQAFSVATLLASFTSAGSAAFMALTIS